MLGKELTEVKQMLTQSVLDKDKELSEVKRLLSQLLEKGEQREMNTTIVQNQAML